MNWTHYLGTFGAAIALIGHFVLGSPDHRAIRRDLEKRGCKLLRVQWLPSRQGLLIDLNGYDPYVEGRTTVWGNVFGVSYRNRTGEILEAVCEMGPDHSVHWTPEHREPGYDKFGNPPNLSTYGNEWRG